MTQRLRPDLVLAPLALLALASACASAASDTPTDGSEGIEASAGDVPWMIKRGHYAEALREAERTYRENPEDPAALEDYRYASTAVLLQQGREALFDRRVEEALGFFQQAHGISPDPVVVEAWIANASHQLAMYWHDQGILAQVGEDLEQARDYYGKALEYEPDYARAKGSLVRVLLQINYRAGMSEEYYDHGVRSLGDMFLDEAHQYFSYSRTYNTENERAVVRRAETRTQLAARRVFVAQQLEQERNFAAAHNEFRIALLLDPDLEQARSGLERLACERDAAEVLREVDRHIMRGDYDEAVAALEKGRSLTKLQVEEFDAMAINIEQARFSDYYEVARTFESDQQYENAVTAYAALLEEAPFFRDAITRKETLESYVREAKKLYRQAMKAENDEGQVRFLRQIEVFWPEYRDVRERLATFVSVP